MGTCHGTCHGTCRGTCRGTCHGAGAPWHWVDHCMKPEAQKPAKPGDTWASELSTRSRWGGCPWWSRDPPAWRSLAAAGSLRKSDMSAQLCLPRGVWDVFSPALHRSRLTRSHAHRVRDATTLTIQLEYTREASHACAAAVCLQAAVAALGSMAECAARGLQANRLTALSRVRLPSLVPGGGRRGDRKSVV